MMDSGLDFLANHPEIGRSWGRCGLVSNQASVTKNFQPAWQVLHGIFRERLVLLAGPQHGFESTVQDNMIETAHATHRPTGLPVYSLYAETREPSEEMMMSLDTLVIDLLVTGCRIYTYKYTMAACLRAAAQYGKKIVVLDRPNPLGGTAIEGNVLENNARSFVGEFPLPTRHGLTMGEAAQFFNQHIQAELEIIRLPNWQSSMGWDQAEKSWVLTSPNLPTLETAQMFPGTVLFEGTNCSEGRGTCLPFLFIGAPYIADSWLFRETVEKYYNDDTRGFYLRPTHFQPTFQKWTGKICNGVQVHIVNYEKVRAVRLGIALMRAAYETSNGAFQWKQPPYEYDFKTLPINLIMGSHDLPQKIIAPTFDPDDKIWQRGLLEYQQTIKPFLIYPRTMRIN